MSQEPESALPRHVNMMAKKGHLESSNRPSKIKPINILQGTIFIKHTIIFPDPRNDFLPLITVSMLNLPENANFNLLKVISKRVESMADKFSNYVTNTDIKPLHYFGVVIIYVGWFLGQCD
jgi:hypothetical protein